MLVVSVAFAAIGIGVSAMLGPRRPTAIKGQTYESGMPTIGTARRRVWIRYYLVAVIFILFDIEVIFLYPWAAVMRTLRDNHSIAFALFPMGFFVLVLIIGLLYEWRKGALDWD